MKRISILLLTCMLLCVTVEAQRVSINWGEAVCQSGSGIFCFKKDQISKNSYWYVSENKKRFIVTLDSNNFKISSKRIIFPQVNGIDLNNVDIHISTHCFRSKIILFITYQHDELTQYYIAEALYDGTVIKPPFLVAETERESVFSHKSFLLSPDSSKILIGIFNDKQKATGKNKSLFRVFTSDLNLVYSKDYESPNTNVRTDDDNNVFIDNQSRIFFIEKYKYSTELYKRSIFILDTPTDRLKEIVLDSLNNKAVKSILLSSNSNGLLTLSGFYNNIENVDDDLYSGVFYGTIDYDETLKIKTTLLENVEKLNFNSSVKVLKSIFYVTKKEGGIILFSEQFSNSNTSCYGNILIININPNGDTLYCRSLLKRQLPVFDYALASYFPIYFENDKTLSLIYYDIKQNIIPTNEEKEFFIRLSKAIPVLVEIDSVGTIQKKALAGLSIPAVKLLPLYMRRVTENEFLIIGLQGYDIRAGSLKLFPNEKNIVFIKDVLPPYKRDTSVANRFIGIGIRKVGIGFGNSHYYSGIRLNVIDKNVKIVNGLNLCLVKTKPGTNNGLSLGLLAANDITQNGISFGLFSNSGRNRNGIAMSPFYSGANKINGIATSGLYIQGDYINGIALSGLYTGAKKKMNGAAFSFLAIASEKLNGFSASTLISTDTTRGVSFAFINFCNHFKGFSCSTHGILSLKSHKNSKFEGLAIAFGAVFFEEIKGVTVCGASISKRQKGLSIGLYNHTKNLKGIQFGLLNYAANNPRMLRYLPIINMHLRRI